MLEEKDYCSWPSCHSYEELPLPGPFPQVKVRKGRFFPATITLSPGHRVHQYDVLRGGAAGVRLHLQSVASVRSRKRAGKIMGTTVLTFVITGAVAAVIMFVVMKLVPRCWSPDRHGQTGAIGDPPPLSDMIVNFFTTDDFVAC